MKTINKTIMHWQILLEMMSCYTISDAVRTRKPEVSMSLVKMYIILQICCSLYVHFRQIGPYPNNIL